MLNLLKNIWLGVVLIAAASAVLLLSDLNRRQTKDPHKKQDLPRLAIMQWTSTDLLDNTVSGMVQGLRQQGFEDGRTAVIRFFNASGDSATANMMARELTGGGYDMILTASTLALQAVAQANREKRIPHLFGGVTDPYGAGVGITGPEPHQHPPHLLGAGTFQPVEGSIRVARLMNPNLKRLGAVWNPSEDNSDACVRKARATCLELGIELVEANAGNTSEVPEAIRSVLSRGVEAVWIGGDTVAMAAINASVSAARAEGVPVFTNDPSDVRRGALFGLGASYEQVGLAVGNLGGKVLRGAGPSGFGVANLVPEVLTLNEPLAAELAAWSVPESVRERAAASQAESRHAIGPAPGRHYRVALLYFGPHPIFEDAMIGIRETLSENGFTDSQNLSLLTSHPNSDMSMLPQVIQRLRDQQPDLIISLSTPCLAAVLAVERKIPIVFGVVSAPLEAGAGESFSNHLPNVTGAVWTAPDPKSFAWLKYMFPGTRTMGVIHNPAEANSALELSMIRSIVREHNIGLEVRSINNASEITEAVQSLFSTGIDAVFGMADNIVVSSFPALAQACRKEKIPLVADDGSLMGSGALFSIGASPRGEGRHTGLLAARVLSGESPAGIPFSPGMETQTTLDFAAAKHLGISFPAGLLEKADFVYNLHALKGRPLSIAMVNLVDSPILALAQAGVVRGLRESGLKDDVDFKVRQYNAQGETAQLPAMLDAALNSHPDLIVTLTTPALMAAMKRVREVPVVFAVASDPAVLGLFTPETRPAHVTGVHDDPPVDRLLEMAIQHTPKLSAVGIVFDPAQPNSVISVEKLRAACKQNRITLYEASAATVTDLSPAVQSVVQRGAGAILLSADNLTATGFPVIRAAAKQAGLPIYTTSVNLIAEGADGAIGDDFEAWGAQAGRMAAKILAGVAPGDLPVEASRIREVVPPAKKETAAARTRPYEIRIVRYNDAQFSADTERGILDGFKKEGLIAGRDYTVRVLNAQGDMATLSAILNSVVADAPDLIMPISTPALQASLRQSGGLPIVFSSVGDGVRAGAGKSETDHLPNVTGISTRSPFKKMAELIKASVPGVQAAGTLFSPAEINSELYRQWFEEALTEEGLTLKSVPVNTSADVSESTTVLLRSGIQVVAQIADNATRPGYAQIIKRTSDAGMAFFCFDSAGMKDGAALALARDYYHTGIEAAEVAVRVLRGTSPGEIPFTNTRTETLEINPLILGRTGISLPEDKLKTAVIHKE